MMATHYKHTQVGLVILAALGAACAGLAGSSLAVSSAVLAVGALLVALVAILFSTLTVVVRDDGVEVYFGPGLIRRTIALSRIRGARTVRTPWYYGWGIRLTPWGWLWNVSGLGGVELEPDDGRRFRIGSDEPERLAEAIRGGIGPAEGAGAGRS